MTRPTVLISILSILTFSSTLSAQQKENMSVDMKGLYSFTMKTIEGKDKPKSCNSGEGMS